MLTDPLAESSLNARALEFAECFWTHSRNMRVLHHDEAGARLVDCGATAQGGFEAGLALARVCLAELGHVSIISAPLGTRLWPHVQVATDHAVAACLASQYAGWQIAVGKFFAMGSGPMRCAAGREPLFDRIGHRESPYAAIGVLECRKPPDADTIDYIAAACRVPAQRLTLLYAPTASIAGSIQVVARSVETALHKLAELGFDLSRIVSAHGIAPLAPVAKDDLASIGRTNDAILYGASVTLMITGDDASLEEVGKALPSSASRDYGAPFSEIFARYSHDFYAVDPHLFSPAHVILQNVNTGRVHEFGRLDTKTVARSFGLDPE